MFRCSQKKTIEIIMSTSFLIKIDITTTIIIKTSINGAFLKNYGPDYEIFPKSVQANNYL